MTSSHELRKMRNVAWFLLIIFAAASIGYSAQDSEPLEETISYLIEYVGKADATFLRNGQSYTPEEAAKHIRSKYEHFRNEIKTPEDFIRLSASKSLLTGKPYIVRLRSGEEMRLDSWLADALKRHQKDKH